MSEPKVILYSQPGCPPCGAEKEFLDSQGVEYEERNIREDPEYVQQLQELGSHSTPTTVIDDEVIIGFDREKISELLDL